MSITENMLTHLQTAASQYLAANMSGSFTPGITRGDGNNLRTLRALQTRGLLVSQCRQGLTEYSLTVDGWQLVADYTRTQCATVITKGFESVSRWDASAPGLATMARQDIKGAEAVLTMLNA